MDWDIADNGPVGFFDDLLVNPVHNEPADDGVAAELQQYRNAPGISVYLPANGGFSNPLDWWRLNSEFYPNIATLARRFLCIPATSAPSERVFSHAGLTIANDRARLLPELADDLVFLHGALLEAEGVADVF